MKMLDRSRNIWQVNLKKSLQISGNVLQVTHRRCYNVSGTSGKLLEEDVATYQERFATYLQKTLQRRCWSGSFRSNPCSIPVSDPYHSDLESFTFCCETVEYVRIFPFFCNHRARRARGARQILMAMSSMLVVVIASTLSSRGIKI